MRVLRLDGIRCVAVMLVILHHHLLLTSGWIGVDLFFVLSGFLITGILRRERLNEHYWKRFYVKRVTRIVPAVAVLLVTVKLLSRGSHGSYAAYILFLGNVADTKPSWSVIDLTVLWSLAVEEHFYMFFPFAVRFLSKQALAIGLTAVVIIEPIARLLTTSCFTSYGPIYFWTFFRLDGLALGALLSIALESDRMRKELTRWSGPAAVWLWSLFVALTVTTPVHFGRDSNTHMFNCAGYSLVDLMCVALIAFVLLHPRSLLSRALELPSVVFVGTISYGVYLCHFAILQAAIQLTGLDGAAVLPITLSATLLVSWTSYKYLERPFIDWGHSFVRNLDDRSNARTLLIRVHSDET